MLSAATDAAGTASNVSSLICTSGCLAVVYGILFAKVWSVCLGRRQLFSRIPAQAVRPDFLGKHCLQHVAHKLKACMTRAGSLLSLVVVVALRPIFSDLAEQSF